VHLLTGPNIAPRKAAHRLLGSPEVCKNLGVVPVYIQTNKLSPLQARLWPREGGEGVEVYLNSSKIAALEGCEWSAARPGRT